MNRRTLLITGGASILILGGLGASVLHSDLREAREPWDSAGTSFSDPRLNALSYAILAPSPHNRQPWLIQLEGDNDLTIYCDTTRLLPETDPYNRQIVLGLGAFIEVLRMAAAEHGFRLDLALFPEGEPSPVLDERAIANISFIKEDDIQKDPLFSFVMDRRTNREEFDQTRRVSNDVLQVLQTNLTYDRRKLFGMTNQDDKVESIKNICTTAWNIEMNTPRTHHESTRLTRVGEAAINKNPDGISISGPLMEALRLSGQLSEDKMNDKSSQAFKGTQDFYTKLITSAMAFAWIRSPDNSRVSQINSGADWLRLHLGATKANLAFHPLSQALQEFPEMSSAYKNIHDLMDTKSPTIVQGLFRLGYASSPPAAPRWPLASRLVEA